MSGLIWNFGSTKSGEAVTAFKIANSCGAYAVITDYGATIQSLYVPNINGGLTDVVLGYDTVAEYEENGGFLGATIGRVGNRIGGAEFSLGGKMYRLCKNDGENTLHGGQKGFDKYLWQGEMLTESSVRFSRLSPDGEESFPGNLNVSVVFTLDDDCTLQIQYDAVSDADTIVNLTNHSYFDLSGCGKAMEQTLQINAERYLELGEGTLPTGRALSVEGTPFDFRTPKPVCRDIDADHSQINAGAGYDHNFCLSGPHAAVLQSDVTGIRMDTFTDMPGVQLYSGNFLDPRSGKNGSRIERRGAVCLETQLYPNAMNCYGFPSPVLHAHQHMHSETCYKFSVIG